MVGNPPKYPEVNIPKNPVYGLYRGRRGGGSTPDISARYEPSLQTFNGLEDSTRMNLLVKGLQAWLGTHQNIQRSISPKTPYTAYIGAAEGGSTPDISARYEPSLQTFNGLEDSTRMNLLVKGLQAWLGTHQNIQRSISPKTPYTAYIGAAEGGFHPGYLGPV